MFILSRIYIYHPEFPFQFQNFHFRSRISIIRSGICIPDPEFPFQIRNFHIRSRISIFDPEIPFQIQNFHFRSRISIPDPEFHYQLVSLLKIEYWILLFYCRLKVSRNHAIVRKIWLKKSNLLGRLNLFSGPDGQVSAL